MDLKFKIENCANSVESAVNAQKAGAYRVELCAGIPEGGTTPSFGDIRVARQKLTSTLLNVIIRPRGGDFLYSPDEIDIMLHDIKVAKQLGANGVVLGCLTADGKVDMENMQKLMHAANQMEVTFHRAFDMCKDPFEALEDIIRLGCHRILTSGQEPTADKGISLIKKLITQADGRIIIMPGCGVSHKNICKIAEKTGATEFHLSARSKVKSGMKYKNPNVSMGGTVTVEEYSRPVTDVNLMKEVIEKLKVLEEEQAKLEAEKPQKRRRRKKEDI